MARSWSVRENPQSQFDSAWQFGRIGRGCHFLWVIGSLLSDANGALVPGARVTLRSATTKEKYSILTTDAGEFRFAEMPAGKYKLEIVSQGFKRLKLNRFALKSGEILRLASMLEVSGDSVMMGVIVEGTPIYSNGTLTVSGDMIQRLPP